MLKNTLISVIFLLTMNLSWASNCYDEHKEGEEHGDEHAKTTKEVKAAVPNIKTKIKISDKEKQEILKVLETNEKLHWSFFKYDGAKVEKLASSIAGQMEKISHKEIKKLLTFAQKQIKTLKAKTPQKENNQTYHMFSMAMIHVMNTYDLGGKYAGYRCPMVRKQWVQNTKKLDKVHNPYAAYMPHCGEKLKPAKK